MRTEVTARVGCRETRCAVCIEAEAPVVFRIAQHKDSNPPVFPSPLYSRSNQRLSYPAPLLFDRHRHGAKCKGREWSRHPGEQHVSEDVNIFLGHERGR
jgi:hypothetical protein